MSSLKLQIKSIRVIYSGLISVMGKKRKELKVCFAASSGGHFEQLMMLKPLMEKYKSFIVMEKTGYAVETDFKTYELAQVNRRERLFPLRILYNGALSAAILLKERPDVVVTTGVLAMVPLCLICKLFGKTVVYIESFAKVTSSTETGKLMYRIADRFYVQWESMLAIYPDAVYVGGVY